ncbi:MFS transporter [Amycolatopsis sp. NPDC051071]|uniref:MFS transporter n=1 Tax=Amycolatopsis sp. NPDC051071 TaxID=3154637 RepID=UPI00341B496F
MSLDTTLSADAVRSSRLAERLLVPAGFVTTAGNAFQITAAAILVFHAEQTTLAVGWLFIAVSIPQVALALLFGKLVDKVDRRMLCVAADLVSAMTAFALPVWLWIGGPANLGSYIANFMLACTAALFMPASNGLIKERIRDERLGKFNSHFEMASNAGMLLASSLAGFLVIWFGATPLFIFNSLTFVVSAVLVYAIGRKPVKAPVAEETTTDSPAPVEAPVHQPIKRLALLYANGNIGLMVANVILTTLILQTFDQGAWMIGVVDALAGVGFIVGAAMYGKVSKRFKGIHLAVLGTLGNLICLAIQPLHYIALMVAIPFAGFCFAQGRIAARTLLMRASPEDRVGRIFGGTQAVGLGLGVGATVVLSTLADATTVPYAFWGLAILQGAIVIGTYFSLAKPLSAQEKKQPAEVLEATAA